jgi:hypothetical protein
LIDALDFASLERFQLELVEAGFETVDPEQRSWVGPIAESLSGLTEAETMKIVFYDGWPFQHPRLLVDGLDERHVSARGEVCLWATGAPPKEWQTFSNYLARIDEWAEHAPPSSDLRTSRSTPTCRSGASGPARSRPST